MRPQDPMTAAERLAALLGLRLGERVPGRSPDALILRGDDPDGSQTILKVDRPGGAYLAEYAALSAVGVCPPLAPEDASGPPNIGTPVAASLKSGHSAPISATRAVGDILSRLTRVITPTDVLGFDDVVWGLLLSTVAVDYGLGDRSPIDIEDCRKHADTLLTSKTATRKTLLHGAMSVDNVVVSEEQSWAINPRPHLGPLEWDAATWCLSACTARSLDEHVAELAKAVEGLNLMLVSAALRFQAQIVLTHRAERSRRA